MEPHPLSLSLARRGRDDRPDDPAWVRLFGERHAGGGPAVTSRAGGSLVDSGLTVDSTVIDPATGELRPWDWAESGAAELNCFTCHLPGANNDARVAALAAGRFGDATTATLLGTGIVEEQGDAWRYNPRRSTRRAIYGRSL